MSGLRTVRGTRDLLPEVWRLRQIEEKACETASRYGYGEIATPIFEFTEVFTRTLGDTSDVVSRRCIPSRTGAATASRCGQRTPPASSAPSSPRTSTRVCSRVFYRGPMFRYERPQEGRLRQFHQVGVELLGVADPLADVEVISGCRFLDRARARRKFSSSPPSVIQVALTIALAWSNTWKSIGNGCRPIAWRLGQEPASYSGFQGSPAIRRSSPARKAGRGAQRTLA